MAEYQRQKNILKVTISTVREKTPSMISRLSTDFSIEEARN